MATEQTGTGKQEDRPRHAYWRILKTVPPWVWILVATVSGGCLVLSILELTGRSRIVKTPGLDFICYLLAVLAGAAYLAFSDRQRDSVRKDRKNHRQ